MSRFQTILDDIKKRKERSESGMFNCIPCPFDRLSNYWPGIEQGKYYLSSAGSKVGKSHITDYMFLYHPYQFITQNRTDIDIKVLYFSLEMPESEKIYQALSHFMYIDSGCKLSYAPKDLRSVKKALSPDMFAHIKQYEPFFNNYLDKVQYIDGIRGRHEINKYIWTYAEKNGIIIRENDNIYYKPNNPNLYTIIIIDHIGLLIPKNETLRECIGKFSSEQLVPIRNIFNFIPVIIQQQANAQESAENAIKYQNAKPSFNGLADCKDTQRDIQLGFGLFDPSRPPLNNKSYNGYDTGPTFRTLNIMGGRENPGNEETPLYFNGAVSYFKEMDKK